MRLVRPCEREASYMQVALVLVAMWLLHTLHRSETGVG